MDITKRLEIKSNMIFMGEKIAFGSECALMDEASIEIQALREQVAELEHCVENRAKQWAEQHIKIADQATTITQLEHALVSEAVNKQDYAQLQLDNAMMREALGDCISVMDSGDGEAYTNAKEALGKGK